MPSVVIQSNMIAEKKVSDQLITELEKLIKSDMPGS